MEENKFGYDDSDFDQDDYNTQDDSNSAAAKSIRGYRIVIIILAVILAALSILYYSIHKQQQADYNLLSQDRDLIQEDLSDLMSEYDDLEVTNDSISQSLTIERHRADSIITALKRERTWNYNKLRQYEKEVGALRTIMKGYIHQIDSLNSLNKQIMEENIGFRKEISSVQLRAAEAEERAEVLNNIVAQGAVMRAGSISMEKLKSNGRETSRIKYAKQLRVDFTLAANDLTDAGNKEIYIRILSPDGYVLTTEQTPTFEFEGERITYSASREVNYQNSDLRVSIFFDGSGFTAGNYKIEIYAEGYLIGSTELATK